MGARLPHPLRRPLSRAALLLGLLLALAACTVGDRSALVGLYETEGGLPREAWTLEDDGTCRIVRDGLSLADCEWTQAERGWRNVIAVRVAEAGGGGRHRTTYVLTPVRLPFGGVTLSLGSRTLRKRD